MGRDRHSVAIELEERFPGAHEIPHLRYELDDAAGAPGIGQQSVKIDGKNDRGRTAMRDDTPSPFRSDKRHLDLWCRACRLGIDRFDHARAFVADSGENADRTEQTRRIVDRKRNIARQTIPRWPCGGRRCRTASVHTVERPQREDEREDKQPDGIADELSRSNVVAMIRGVSWPPATWIATSSDPKVNTRNESVSVIVV